MLSGRDGGSDAEPDSAELRASHRVPLVAYHNAVLPGLRGDRGAPVQFEVWQTLDDALAGKDTVLDFSLELIRARSEL